MNNNYRLFFKSRLIYNILSKTLILFFVGLLFRFLINNFLYSEYLMELFALFLSLFPLSGFLLTPEGGLDIKIINNSMSLLKNRPRDLIINNDYEFKDRYRRKVQWIIIGQFDDKFRSYKEFKEQWDANIKLSNQIQNKYDEKKREILIFKKTFLWFINRRNGG